MLALHCATTLACKGEGGGCEHSKGERHKEEKDESESGAGK